VVQPLSRADVTVDGVANHNLRLNLRAGPGVRRTQHARGDGLELCGMLTPHRLHAQRPLSTQPHEER
jgi:hypothetical protein